jgi:hypothetical protein
MARCSEPAGNGVCLKACGCEGCVIWLNISNTLGNFLARRARTAGIQAQIVATVISAKDQIDGIKLSP